MIKDFDTVKKQLQELSGVINGFKSEAVQLKVVELLFQRMGVETADAESDTTPAKSSEATPSRRQPRKKKTLTKAKEDSGRKPRATGGRPGPGAMVSKLIAEGFFKTPKKTQEIINHCKSVHAYTYNTSELSVALTRALRSGSLKRMKNEQNQFEYSE